MSTHARHAIAAVPAAATALLHVPAGLLAASVVGLFLAGCASAPRQLVASPDPADPRAPAAHVAYRSTTASYVSQRPVAPGPWRQQNERVTPPAKSDQ